MVTRDQIIFNIFYDMQKQAHFSLISSDKASMAMYSPGKPLWIWTQNGLESDKIKSFFQKFLWQNGGKKLTGIVAATETAHICARLYMEQTAIICQSHLLIAYFAREINYAAGPHTFLIKPSLQDIPTLAGWIGCFYEEALREHLTVQQQEKMAQTLTASGLLFVLATRDTLVAMGMLTEQNDFLCRLNLIYTPWRGYGYGKGMTAALAKTVLSQGKIPMLYTDSENQAANHIYRSLGFEEAGRLTEIIFEGESR